MAMLPETLDIRVRLAPDDASCASCRWWSSDPTDADFIRDLAQCKRRAPLLVLYDGGKQANVLPYTAGNYLCGEWEAKL